MVVKYPNWCYQNVVISASFWLEIIHILGILLLLAVYVFGIDKNRTALLAQASLCLCPQINCPAQDPVSYTYH